MNYTSKQILIGLFLYNNFDWDKVFQQMRHKEMLDVKWMNKNLELIDILGNYFITIVDKEYPSCLKGLDKPPIILQKDVAKQFSEIEHLILIHKDEEVDVC